MRERISDSKIVRKILRFLFERFRLKVANIEENKDIDFIRVDELVGSLQTYEMTLSISHKPKESAFKASKNEKKNSKKVGKEEFMHMTKCVKDTLKFQRRSNRKQKVRERKFFEKFGKEKGKRSSKGKKKLNFSL